MSYSIISQCWNCNKKDKCTDLRNIEDVVSNRIHQTSIEEGHKGAGVIILSCCNQNT